MSILIIGGADYIDLKKTVLTLSGSMFRCVGDPPCKLNIKLCLNT